MADNMRTILADLLRAELPTKWDVYDHGVSLENPLKPVVVVRQTSLGRTPGAPRLYRDAGLTVGLVEPGLDLAKLEDALDDDLDTLLDALEAVDLPGLIWTGADRATFDERFQGYEVSATITYEKDTTP